MPDAPTPETPAPAAQAAPPILDILGAPDAPEIRHLAACLAGATPEPAIRYHDDLATALKSADGAAPVLVPVTPPEIALAELMQAGHPPDAARETWRETALALRDQCRPHRRDILLIAAPDLATTPEALRALNARLGLGLPETGQAAQQTAAPPPLRLLARVALEQAPNDSELASELEAMILGAPPQSYLALIEDAFAAQAKLTGLETEYGLLRDTLAGVQEELAQLYETARAEHRSLDAQVQLHKAAHEAAAHQIEQARADQARREAVLGAESLAAQARETALLEELERVYSSRSWRVTGPLRRASGGLHKGN